MVFEGEPLAEGAVVTIVAREGDETFEVSSEDERALLEAIPRRLTVARSSRGKNCGSSCAAPREDPAANRNHRRGADADRGGRCVVGREDTCRSRRGD